MSPGDGSLMELCDAVELTAVTTIKPAGSSFDVSTITSTQTKSAEEITVAADRHPARWVMKG